MCVHVSRQDKLLDRLQIEESCYMHDIWKNPEFKFN